MEQDIAPRAEERPTPPPWPVTDWQPVTDEARRAEVLDAFEAYLTGQQFADPQIPGSAFAAHLVEDVRTEGLDYPATAFTMVGRRRLHQFRTAVETVLAEGIPGAIVETGVWRGGASMLARAVLALHGARDRQVVLADSFAGLPPPSEEYPHDQTSDLHTRPELAVPLEVVQENFRYVGLLDDQVRFVPGWFSETMPTLDVAPIAVLRLDGDMYESTIDPLQHLYDRVSPGGFVIIDDYYLIEGCRFAVHDFLDGRGIDVEIQRIDHVGAYFRTDR